jgi:aminopeptidase N
MIKYFLILMSVFVAEKTIAQFTFSEKDDSWKKVYRSTEPRINNLVHTKLDVRFDYTKSYLNGKAWITLKPHFYPTDTLRLDAKGMNIHKVAIVQMGKNKDLRYTYDSMSLFIKLDKLYRGGEAFTIYIDYTAKPDELRVEGSAAITDAKGLYFINPLGTEPNKPTQIWTQGETEASSVWFPTIDKPNQKTTSEISMTVPAKYVTLSNGKLTTQKKNLDGTRTDTWKMDLPHAPYLFFMGVGDYAVVKDTYKGKEVSYYVEKEYEKVARKIFGNTPEMMKYFSSITGVEYPWAKYSQIVGRDYVSGAMENTTATLHQESAQQNARELVDGNRWEAVIAHELFHHWFGDLVTSESWSNLTLNESFANYSEVLWNEYKYGKDFADDHFLSDMLGYLGSNSHNKDLVRFYYRDKEDMFDAVSYNKGGNILHMLRNYIGDSAFFKSLNLYLTTNKFKSAEAAQLRLAFEEITGKDLQWFFNQWYYGSGHPSLNINYAYNNATQTSSVFIKQTQESNKVFKLPFAIDIYNGANKTRHNVWLDKLSDTFHFKVSAKPDLINVDADKILLAEKRDNKTLQEFVHQYRYAKKYLDRREALEFAGKHLDKPEAKALIIEALNDPFHKLRELSLAIIRTVPKDENLTNKILTIAKKDPYRTTRAVAIDILSLSEKSKNLTDFYIASVKDSSYSVAGAALEALINVDENKAMGLLPELKKDAKGRLAEALKMAEILTKGDVDFDEMTSEFDAASLYDRAQIYGDYILFLGNVHNTANFIKGVDRIIEFRDIIAGFSAEAKAAINEQLTNMMNKKKAYRNSSKDAAAIDAQVAYVDKKIRS